VKLEQDTIQPTSIPCAPDIPLAAGRGARYTAGHARERGTFPTADTCQKKHMMSVTGLILRIIAKQQMLCKM
jgi:hypothetical protein